MGQFSCGFVTPAFFESGRPICDIRTSATDYARILAISGSAIDTTGTVWVVGVGRPAVEGTAISNAIVMPSDDPNTPLSSVTIGLDWTSPPSAPTNFLRRTSIGSASAGAQFAFEFPEGVVMAPSDSLILWLIAGTNATNTLAFYINVTVEV